MEFLGKTVDVFGFALGEASGTEGFNGAENDLGGGGKGVLVRVWGGGVEEGDKFGFN